MQTSPHKAPSATGYVHRHFSVSPLNQRQLPRRLFREGSIGSKSWKQKDADQISSEDCKSSQPHGDSVIETVKHALETPPLNFPSPFGYQNMRFPSSTGSSMSYSLSPQSDNNSPEISSKIRGRTKSRENMSQSETSKLDENSFPEAPPISSVPMPRDLTRQFQSPELLSSSQSLCTQPAPISRPTKSPQSDCADPKDGSRDCPKRSFRLANAQHEELIERQSPGVQCQPSQCNATDSPLSAGINKIGQCTTTEFFQRASIRGRVDSPNLRVVTVQGGYYIDSRDCDSGIKERSQESNSLVFHQATYEPPGNHEINHKEFVGQPSHLHDAMISGDSTQEGDPIQFVATALKRKELRIEQLSRELQASKSQAESSSRRLEDREKGKMLERITSIQEQQKEASSSFEAAALEKSEYKTRVQNFQRELKSLIDDKVYLSKKQEDFVRTFSDVQKSRMEEKQMFMSHIEGLQERCELDQKKYSQQSEEVTELNQRCEAFQLSVQRLERETQTQKEKITELLANLDTRNQVIQELETALASSKSEIKALSNSMDAERETLISKVMLAEETLHKSQRDMSRSDNRLSEAQVFILALEKRYNELVEQTHKPDTTSSSVGTSDDPAIDLHSLMTHLRFQLDDMEAKNCDVSTALSILEFKHTSTLAEKAILEERLKELLVSNNAANRREEDNQIRIAESQRIQESMRKKLEESEIDKARIYSSIPECLSTHSAQLKSAIQEYIAQLEGTRKTEAVESQNQLIKIHEQTRALEAKLEEKTKELSVFVKENGELVTKLSEQGSRLAKIELDLISSRAKLQLMETDKENKQLPALHDQKNDQQVQETVNRIDMGISTQISQTLPQTNVNMRFSQDAPMLLSEVAALECGVSMNLYTDFLAWPLDLTSVSCPGVNSSVHEKQIDHLQSLKSAESAIPKSVETTQENKKRKSVSFSEDRNTKQQSSRMNTTLGKTKVTYVSALKTNPLETVLCESCDDDDSGDFTASKAAIPTESMTQQNTGGSSRCDNARGRGKTQGRRGRGKGRGKNP
ncbi:hypothetical protein BGZ49_003461 [Haplosporangium sp. Z 27]|nr:hypothetical protein BGZ49_003461 [Haplosporangium sp. Z 27]